MRLRKLQEQVDSRPKLRPEDVARHPQHGPEIPLNHGSLRGPPSRQSSHGAGSADRDGSHKGGANSPGAQSHGAPSPTGQHSHGYGYAQGHGQGQHLGGGFYNSPRPGPPGRQVASAEAALPSVGSGGVGSSGLPGAQGPSGQRSSSFSGGSPLTGLGGDGAVGGGVSSRVVALPPARRATSLSDMAPVGGSHSGAGSYYDGPHHDDESDHLSVRSFNSEQSPGQMARGYGGKAMALRKSVSVASTTTGGQKPGVTGSAAKDRLVLPQVGPRANNWVMSPSSTPPGHDGGVSGMRLGSGPLEINASPALLRKPHGAGAGAGHAGAPGGLGQGSRSSPVNAANRMELLHGHGMNGLPPRARGQ